MLAIKNLLPLALLTVGVLASPVTVLQKRQGPITCADDPFVTMDVNKASAKGCELFKAGEQIGKNDYPHRFNNREGFDFAVEGPYQEYPIMADLEIYDGGQPGPHRVVFDEDCNFAGLITHIGAPPGGFVECVAGEGTNVTISSRL